MRLGALALLVVLISVQCITADELPNLESRIKSGLDTYQKSISAIAQKADRELATKQAQLRRNSNEESLSLIKRIERDRLATNQIFDFPIYLSPELHRKVSDAREKYRKVLIGVRDEYMRDATGNHNAQVKQSIDRLSAFDGEICGLFDRMVSCAPVEKKGVWIMKADELLSESPRDEVSYLAFGNPNWTDYSFEAEVAIAKGAVTLQARRIGEENWSLDIGTVDNKNNLDLMPNAKGVNGFQDIGRRWMAKRTDFEWNQWSHFRLEHAGNIVKVHYNNIEVAASENPKLQTGGVALLVHKGSVVKFRNIKVIDVNGVTLWRDWFF